MIQVTVDEKQDRITELFDKYNLLTLPVVDEDGKLAGINTAIYSRTGEYAGIGFATPSNLVRRVVEGALGGGVKLPW